MFTLLISSFIFLFNLHYSSFLSFFFSHSLVVIFLSPPPFLFLTCIRTLHPPFLLLPSPPFHFITRSPFNIHFSQPSFSFIFSSSLFPSAPPSFFTTYHYLLFLLSLLPPALLPLIPHPSLTLIIASHSSTYLSTSPPLPSFLPSLSLYHSSFSFSPLPLLFSSFA